MRRYVPSELMRPVDPLVLYQGQTIPIDDLPDEADPPEKAESGEWWDL